MYNFSHWRTRVMISISPHVWPVLTWRFLPLCLRPQSHYLLLSTVMTTLTQSCGFDIFACRVACRLLLPPGAEQEIILATAVTTDLTNTKAAQLNQTITAFQYFHIKSKTTPFQDLNYTYRLKKQTMMFVLRGKNSKLNMSQIELLFTPMEKKIWKMLFVNKAFPQWS